MNSSLQTIIKQLNMKQLETQIALQCAPVVLGIKLSNLLIIDQGYQYKVKCIFYKTTLSYYQLYEYKERIAFLVFNRKALGRYLKQEEVQRLLRQMRYQNDNLERILQEVARRFRQYFKNRQNFPHELGLLLGYPYEDVNGFILQQGRGYLYSGYWKVYKDVDRAKKNFENFDKAKLMLLTWVLRGGTIRSVIAFRREVMQEFSKKMIPSKIDCKDGHYE